MVQMIPKVTCRLSNSIGGQEVTPGNTKLLFNVTDFNDDSSIFTPDLPNNQLELAVGRYRASAAMSIFNVTTNAILQASIKLRLDGVDIVGAFSSTEWLYQPLGITRAAAIIPPFEFSVTTAGDPLAVYTTDPPIGQAIGSNNTLADAVWLYAEYLGE